MEHPKSQVTNSKNSALSRAFKKMGFQICKEDIDSIIKYEPGAIERVLRLAQLKVWRVRIYYQISIDNSVLAKPAEDADLTDFRLPEIPSNQKLEITQTLMRL